MVCHRRVGKGSKWVQEDWARFEEALPSHASRARPSCASHARRSPFPPLRTPATQASTYAMRQHQQYLTELGKKSLRFYWYTTKSTNNQTGNNFNEETSQSDKEFHGKPNVPVSEITVILVFSMHVFRGLCARWPSWYLLFKFIGNF